jgi:TonB-linked SusC/RagA family outer membrane protein
MSRSPFRIRIALAAATVAALLVPGDGLAQQVGTVTGTVINAGTGQPVPSVQVHIPALQMGVLTSAQGRFTLANVPVGRHEVRAEVIGYQTVTQPVDVTAGATVSVELRLESRAINMQEIVVTGVAGATPRSQLPFTVERVEIPDFQPVPVSSAGGLIQAKVAGAKIIMGSGQPGEEPSIQLRGPTSITGSQEPLVIIDGVVTQGRLADIDPMDIASIEVVKGAAAASLYGSRAQAGVVEITTKRGARVPVGQIEVTVRNMVQVNSIERILQRVMTHPYRLNAEGTAFVNRAGEPIQLPSTSGNFVLDDGGNGTNAFTAFQDNLYPGQLWDPMRQFFNPGNFYSSNLSVSGNEGNTQYRASFRYTREEGAIKYHDGLHQSNFRLNVDHRLTDAIQLALSTYYVKQDQGLVEQGGNSGPIFAMTFLSPKSNLGAMSADPDAKPGEPSVVGDQMNFGTNPLYTLWSRDWTRTGNRFMGSFDANYAPLSWLSFQGNVSYDRGDDLETQWIPNGTKRPTQPPVTGSLMKEEESITELNGSLTASIAANFGDLTTRTRFRYLAEGHTEHGFSVEGSNLLVAGTPRLALIQGEPDIDSFERSIRSQGFFVITAATYKDRYVLDLLGRRDGSSLFGPEERWQNYYRVSTAWRMAQESWWPFAFINEFKPRFSLGTAGGRPGFSAQYQTYSVDPGQIIPRILGNNALKPELAREKEYGIDAVISNRFRLQLNYVDLEVEDQLLLVPLPSFAGFESQWRNGGTLASTTWEGTLEAALVERPNLLWTARLNLDRTKQTIVKLTVPPYKVVDLRAGMWVREGEPLGAFYGLKWADNCAIDLPAGTDCSEFQVNDDGLLVWVGAGNSWREGFVKDLWGTSAEVNGVRYNWGIPIRSILDDGLTKLGESLPDLNASLFQDFQWRNLGVSVLFDGEFGAQIYHQTRQWSCRDNRCAEADQRAKPDELKKPLAYYGAQGVYAQNTNNSWFVEDGDYVKLREVSLRYTLDGNTLPSFLGRIGVERATINLSGRNVKTWTKYPGYDPEVGKNTFGGSAAIGRIDEYFYPNYRSFGIDLELVF